MVRSERGRLIVAGGCLLLPAKARRWAMVRLLGYEIAPDAQVGRSVVLVDRLVMRSGARLGSLNLIKNCDLVEMGEGSVIGSLNWITGIRRTEDTYVQRDRRRTLRLGAGAGITYLHFIDCCDLVEFGEFSWLGGVRCQILTHGVDGSDASMMCAPVVVGERVLINTGAILVAGTQIADRTLIAAGAVVHGKLDREHTLYGGVPAVARRAMDPNWGWFVRDSPHIR